jgi:hypothetical protein
MAPIRFAEQPAAHTAWPEMPHGFRSGHVICGLLTHAAAGSDEMMDKLHVCPGWVVKSFLADDCITYLCYKIGRCPAPACHW